MGQEGAFFPRGKEAAMSTITVTLEVSSPKQEAMLQQLHGLLGEMQQLALTAPLGRVMDFFPAD